MLESRSVDTLTYFFKEWNPALNQDIERLLHRLQIKHDHFAGISENLKKYANMDFSIHQ